MITKFSALGLMIALAYLPSASVATNPQRITHTLTIDELPEKTADARNILDWVEDHAPASFAPLGYGRVHVERSALSPLHSSADNARTESGPPGKLPDSGVSGEIYKVENIFPDGSIQSWEFKWVEPSTGHGGRWDLIAYSYRKGNDPVNVQ